MTKLQWLWPKADLSGGADGSAMSKLFRGGALSDTALLAREAVQNSNDAAETFRKTHADIPFKMVFRFVSLYDDDKARVAKALNLHAMRDRRQQYKKHSKDPLQSGNVLESLDDPKSPLKLLFVEDYGTHGLFGHPSTGKKSHLFMAMYYIGASDKAADEGGSYGFGKSALERASRTHSVIAHTVFEPVGKDPARSRLVGFTWWPDLQENDTLYNGRASFADLSGGDTGAPVPFEDLAADTIAAELGFVSRDADQPAELGTSFLIVDPSIEPDALLEELEKWWWPALEEHQLDVEVVLPSTEVKVPKPAQNPFVAQFIRAFRIATGSEQPGDPNRERLASKDWRDRGSGGQDLGALALVAPDNPIEEDGDESDGSPLVALMRGPRMVIAYQRYGRRRVALRGAFVASDKANRLLRETEPSSHDRWTTNSSGDLSAEAVDTAKAVMSKIGNSVSKMSKDIAPPPPKRNQSLGHFSKLMSGFMGSMKGGGKGVPSGGERIELTFPKGRPEPERVDDEHVKVASTFTVRVADAAKKQACLAQVACHLFIHEDDKQSRSTCEVRIRPKGKSHGFTRESDGSWIGPITKADKVTFVAESEAYPNLWTTSLQPSVTRISEWSDS